MKNAKFKALGALAAAVICVLGIYLSAHNKRSAATQALKSEHTTSAAVHENTTEQTTIVVYITGEVGKPDVYSMPLGSRVKDIIEKAGGFTDKADISELNLARRLTDGEKIVVNNIDDKVDKTPDLGENIKSDIVNINSADEEALKKLDGIGDELAANIIEYRNKYGAFTSVEEIREVEGIGNTIFEKIKDRITI